MCMYIYMYICTCEYTPIHIPSIHTDELTPESCIYIYIHTHTHICICIHIYICICIYIYIYMCVCICASRKCASYSIFRYYMEYGVATVSRID